MMVKHKRKLLNCKQKDTTIEPNKGDCYLIDWFTYRKFKLVDEWMVTKKDEKTERCRFYNEKTLIVAECKKITNNIYLVENSYKSWSWNVPRIEQRKKEKVEQEKERKFLEGCEELSRTVQSIKLVSVS